MDPPLTKAEPFEGGFIASLKIFLGKCVKTWRRREQREQEDQRCRRYSMIQQSQPGRDFDLWMSPYQSRFITEMNEYDLK